MANLYPECPLVREIELCDVGFFDRTGDFIVAFNPGNVDPSQTGSVERLAVHDEWINETVLPPGMLVSNDDLEVSYVK